MNQKLIKKVSLGPSDDSSCHETDLLSWRSSQCLEEPGSSPGGSSASGWGWSMVGWGRWEIGTSSSTLYFSDTHCCFWHLLASRALWLAEERRSWQLASGSGRAQRLAFPWAQSVPGPDCQLSRMSSRKLIIASLLISAQTLAIPAPQGTLKIA